MEGMRLVDEMRRKQRNFAQGYSVLISGLVSASYSFDGVESVFERLQATGSTPDNAAISCMVGGSSLIQQPRTLLS